MGVPTEPPLPDRHPNQDDLCFEWQFEGHAFLGQPSVVWRAPFHVDAGGMAAAKFAFAGYSTWDGSDGVLHPPDGTITVGTPGTGAGRLAATVSVGSCR